MCNKVFSIQFDMGNPIPSLFLDNVQQKLVKQYKKCFLQSFPYCNCPHCQLVLNFRNASKMCLTCAIKCVLSILLWPIQIHHHFQAMFNGSLSNNIKTVIYRLFSILKTVTITLLEILELLPRIYLTCAKKCSPSSLVWAIQIHQ